MQATEVGQSAGARAAFGRIVLTGLVCGVVVGAGLRTAMRFAAISDPRAVEFTFGGTTFVVLLGLPVGVVLALLYASVFRRFRGGLWLQAVLAAGLAGLAFVSDPTAEASIVGERWINAVTFPGAFVAGSLLLSPVYAWAGRRPSLTTRTAAGALAGSLVGPVAAWVVALYLVGSGRAGGSAPDHWSELVGGLTAIGLQAAIIGGLLGTLLALTAMLPRRRTAPTVVLIALLGAALWVLVTLRGGPGGPQRLGPEPAVLTVGSAFAALVMGGFARLAQRLSR